MLVKKNHVKLKLYIHLVLNFVSFCTSNEFLYISFQLLLALEKAYAISSASKEDINQLLKALGHIRSLLLVQVAVDEEESMKTSLKYLLF